MNRGKNIQFWRAEVKFSFNFGFEGSRCPPGSYPWVACGQPEFSSQLSRNLLGSDKGCKAFVGQSVPYPKITSGVIQEEGPVVYGRKAKETNIEHQGLVLLNVLFIPSSMCVRDMCGHLGSTNTEKKKDQRRQVICPKSHSQQVLS